MISFLRILMAVTATHVISGQQCQEPDASPRDSNGHFPNPAGFLRTSRHQHHHRSILHLSDVPSRYKQIRTSLIGGSSFNCSNRRHVASIFSSPTCPLHIVVNRDENRSPSVLVETLCACTKCTERTPLRGEFRTCALLTEYVVVYRRVACVDGSYVYGRVLEPVRSGCPCSRPSWRHGAEPVLTPKSVVRRQSSRKPWFLKTASRRQR